MITFFAFDLLFYFSVSVPLSHVKDEVLDHVFFWKRNRRCSFFIYGIQGVLHQPDFKTRVANLQFIPIDWNQNDHDGLLTAMNKYRKEQGMPVYGEGRIQYVLFFSGAYTHEDELDPHLNVDNTMKKHCPHLCFELVKIVRELGYHVWGRVCSDGGICIFLAHLLILLSMNLGIHFLEPCLYLCYTLRPCLHVWFVVRPALLVVVIFNAETMYDLYNLAIILFDQSSIPKCSDAEMVNLWCSHAETVTSEFN